LKKTTTSATSSHLIVWSLGLFATLASTCATADVIAGTGIPSATTLGQRTATQLVGKQAGIGHALIVPYYTTQSGNVSVFSITNIDRANGKAVKVRVRGASNGDSLLSLTVLMGPGDVWNATLRQGANGIAELVTYDASCAVPRVAAGVAQPLSTSRLDNPAWSDADKANQTREGYVEILSMADIPRTSPTSKLFDAIGRVIDPAKSCAETGADATAIFGAAGNANHTTEASAASIGLAAPTSGIAGKWLIINAPETTTFAGSMYALRAVDDNGEDARANFVLFPQAVVPYPGPIDDVTADPLLRTVAYAGRSIGGVWSNPTASPVITAAMHDLPDLSTPYVVAAGNDAALLQAQRLIGSMAVGSIQNENASEPSLAAKTDWVVSIPAQRYQVAMNYAAPSNLQTLFSSLGASFRYEPCFNTYAQAFDREGITRTGGMVYIVPYGPRLCGVVNVLDFQGSSATSASVTRVDMNQSFMNGWVRLYTYGLPVIGSAFIKFYNPSASPGISGNYGITFDHWLTR
jgi:hypothetical protein